MWREELDVDSSRGPPGFHQSDLHLFFSFSFETPSARCHTTADVEPLCLCHSHRWRDRRFCRINRLLAPRHCAGVGCRRWCLFVDLLCTTPDTLGAAMSITVVRRESQLRSLSPSAESHDGLLRVLAGISVVQRRGPVQVSCCTTIASEP